MGIDSEQRITFFIADIASFYYLLLSTIYTNCNIYVMAARSIVPSG